MLAAQYHGSNDTNSLKHRTQGLQDLTELNTEESTASILQSIKEQELQFEQLTRELVEERKSVAGQVERCNLGSETVSMSSISSTDESFRWRAPRSYDPPRYDEESETESRLSGSNLVDSCLKVLQDRALTPSDNYRDYLPDDIYNQQNHQQTTTTVTKVITNREIREANPQLTPNTSHSYINYSYQDLGGPPAAQSPRSPANSYRDASPPPAQVAPPAPQRDDYYTTTTTTSTLRDATNYDSLDQQQSFRQDFHDLSAAPVSTPPPQRLDNEPPFQNGPYGGYPNNAPSPRQPDSDSFHGSQQPDDSFRRFGDYTTTTTTTTVINDNNRLVGDSYRGQYSPNDSRRDDQSPGGRGDQYGSAVVTETIRDVQYSSQNLHQDSMSTLPRDRPTQPMDSPRSDRFNDRGPPYGSQPRLVEPPFTGAPPGGELDPNRRSPSINSTQRGMDIRWRNPDLPEVIEYLSHHNDMVKANAAAYLQHLCFMDDDTKAKTRGLGGIPVLVELVNSDIPEVHRAACGALKNLSYGRANEENKKAIKNAGGIPALIRLLRKTMDNDVRELVTGILWNLSSAKDLKRPIIDDGLTVLVDNVIVPHSGWDPNQPPSERKPARDIYWSTVFRNASGVLRNISSDGHYARTKLRECEGLVDSIVFIVQAAIGKSDIDNKSVENCVCVLRNLSYACQEVQDKDYLSHRAVSKQDRDKGDATGCFGGNKKKKDSKDPKSRNAGVQNPNFSNPGVIPRGMALLWHPSIVPLYLPLLYDCTNPETLEAAAGAIQNLAACDWQPSCQIRETVRKQKGLPVLVELLNLEADKVVCAAATALRNLSLDPQSKELIGKYAMRQLVTRLPDQSRSSHLPNDETICALEALIYEVIKSNTEFATSLLSEGGVDRLMFMVKSDQFEYRVRKYASSILTKMWDFKELHSKYRERGWKDVNFLVKPMDPKRGSPSKSLPSSAENTLNRPGMDQSGPTVPGYNENTLPYLNRQPVNNTLAREQLGDSGSYNSRQHPQANDIPMTTLGPHPQSAVPGRGYPDSPRSGHYGTNDLSRQDDVIRQEEFMRQEELRRQDEEARRQEDLRRLDDQHYPGSNTPSLRRQQDTSYDRGNQSYDRGAPLDFDPRLDDQGAAYNDYGSRKVLSQYPPSPTDPLPPRDADLSMTQEYGGVPSAGQYPPAGGDPSGIYTPQGSEYSHRDDYSGRQASYREDFPGEPHPPHSDYRPPGAVPMFGPASGPRTPQLSEHDSREPLYARVVKQGDSRLHLEGSPQATQGGADSWV